MLWVCVMANSFNHYNFLSNKSVWHGSKNYNTYKPWLLLLWRKTLHSCGVGITEKIISDWDNSHTSLYNSLESRGKSWHTSCQADVMLCRNMADKGKLNFV